MPNWATPLPHRTPVSKPATAVMSTADRPMGPCRSSRWQNVSANPALHRHFTRMQRQSPPDGRESSRQRVRPSKRHGKAQPAGRDGSATSSASASSSSSSRSHRAAGPWTEHALPPPTRGPWPGRAPAGPPAGGVGERLSMSGRANVSLSTRTRPGTRSMQSVLVTYKPAPSVTHTEIFCQAAPGSSRLAHCTRWIRSLRGMSHGRG